jgi:pimeloyl-ACP methyl ester carboxylesterase
MMPVHVATPDGVNLAVYEWGQPKGRDVLFVHGFCSGAMVWMRQRRSNVAAVLRCVAYDLRGHGSSDKPLEPVYYKEPRRWADELRAVMDGLAMDHPVVVAWGYGGVVLGHYLNVHGGSRLGGVVLAGAITGVAPELAGPARRHVPHMLSENVAENVAATRAYLRASFAVPPVQEDFELLLGCAMMVPLAARRGMIGPDVDMDDALAALEMPALVVHGSADALVLPEMSRRVAKRLRRGEFGLYEGCGHAPFYESPDRFNRTLIQFAKDLRA